MPFSDLLNRQIIWLLLASKLVTMGGLVPPKCPSPIDGDSSILRLNHEIGGRGALVIIERLQTSFSLSTFSDAARKLAPPPDLNGGLTN